MIGRRACQRERIGQTRRDSRGRDRGFVRVHGGAYGRSRAASDDGTGGGSVTTWTRTKEWIVPQGMLTDRYIFGAEGEELIRIV